MERLTLTLKIELQIDQDAVERSHATRRSNSEGESVSVLRRNLSLPPSPPFDWEALTALRSLGSY